MLKIIKGEEIRAVEDAEAMEMEQTREELQALYTVYGRRR